MTFLEKSSKIVQQHQISQSVAMHAGLSQDGTASASKVRSIWNPESHYSVSGERQPLWKVEFRHLKLQSILAENSLGRSTVYQGFYEERETGISHDVAVKKFPPPRSIEEQEQIHRELSVMFMASSRYILLLHPFAYFR
jgi:hypothetical protein